MVRVRYCSDYEYSYEIFTSVLCAGLLCPFVATVPYGTRRCMYSQVYKSLHCDLRLYSACTVTITYEYSYSTICKM